MSAAEQLLAAIDARPGAWLVAVAGIPGSGKTTICEQVRELRPRAMVVPMDGYHIPRCRLTPEGHERRGARFTFDDAAFRADLSRLRETHVGSFPAFDHAVKDPEPNAIRVAADVPLVLVEGLYLLMRDWALEPLFDLTVFLDCDLDVATERLWPRHLAAGIAATPEAARHRAETNDWWNAEDILGDGCRERADLVIVTDGR